MGCFGRKEKRIRCTIILLDETDIVHEIEKLDLGEDLLTATYKHLNLLETAYFGLRYLEASGESRWLDPAKKVTKQLKDSSGYTFYFGVKFYASDPCKLQEEITRYLFVLQIKQDILQGRFPVNFELGAELFALSLQSELGDYDPRRHDRQYVSEFRFLPHQSSDLEEKVSEIHKSLSGKVSSVVEMAFLENVKWQDMYGVDLHVVMGDDNVEYFLCLTPSGILIMKNGVKINNYFWPRITKTFFKGKYFMLRVRNKANEENTFAFELSSKDSCKHLWKCCIEHHAFFRLMQVKDLSGIPFTLFRLGSKHRYSGRTEQQIRADMKILKRPPPAVVRVPSRRYPKRLGEPDGAEADHKMEEQKILTKSKSKEDILLTPAVTLAPLYRSVSTPAELPTLHSDSPSKTAPWENPNQKGLYTHSSRQSLCSSHGSERKHGRRSHSRRRSPSVESEISSNSRHKKHKSKRHSDNESDISKSSRGSRTSKSSRGSTSHRKSRKHGRDTASDSDSNSKKNRRHRSRSSASNHALISSEDQWKMVQMQQEKTDIWPQNAVVRDLSQRKSGYMNSGIDTESEITYKHRKKHRRHSRSRSRSPDSKQAMTNEIRKHIKYSLIDPRDLTEEQKQEILYTKVETENDLVKVRQSPALGKPKYKLAKVSSRTSLEKVSQRKSVLQEDDPPPPYSPTKESPSNKQEVKRERSNLNTDSQNKMLLEKPLIAYSNALVSDSSSSSVTSSLLLRKAKSVLPERTAKNEKMVGPKIQKESNPSSSSFNSNSRTSIGSAHSRNLSSSHVAHTTQFHSSKHQGKEFTGNYSKPLKQHYSRSRKTEL